MTITEYREKYGADFEAQLHKPWFAALLALLDAQHPLRKLKTKGDGDKLHGAAMYLNEIGGYDACLDIFRQLAQAPEPQAPEPPDSFAEPEILPETET